MGVFFGFEKFFAFFLFFIGFSRVFSKNEHKSRKYKKFSKILPNHAKLTNSPPFKTILSNFPKSIIFWTLFWIIFPKNFLFQRILLSYIDIIIYIIHFVQDKKKNKSESWKHFLWSVIAPSLPKGALGTLNEKTSLNPEIIKFVFFF